MTNTHSSVATSQLKSRAQDIFWITFGVIALIAGSEIKIPLPWTPVPITLQTFVVVTLALMLPARRALTAIAVYLSLGAIGVPIFSGWTAGLLRTTSGYLVGFFLAALALSPLRQKLLAMRPLQGITLTYLINDCIICASGMVWLHFWSEVPFTQLLVAGWLPFIPGGVVKTSAAWTVARRMR
jgi:biotin transport system substrate-specific component